MTHEIPKAFKTALREVYGGTVNSEGRCGGNDPKNDRWVTALGYITMVLEESGCKIVLNEGK